MVVDSHVHLWDEQLARADWLADPSNDAIRRPFRLADYADAVDGHGIESAIVVTARQSTTENARLLAECAGSGLVAGVVGWIDLTWPFDEDVVRLVDGLLGVRHSVISEAPDWLDRPDVSAALAGFAATGRVLELLVSDRDLPSVIRCADAQPSTTIVVDHLGNPPERSAHREQWAIWHTAIGALAKRPNVRLKLSGAARDARTVDAALEAFGPGRMMFGSDWPVSLLHDGFGSELRRRRDATAALSPAERAQLFSSTALASYGLAA